jgi:hypothetical protein
MAKYLWVGRDYSDVSPTSLRVDKYCWNTPGNWKVMQSVNGVNQWVATQDVPGAGDDAVIGGEVQVPNNVRYSSQLPGASGEAPGWIRAKCPLLFGGYSGGIGAGTWSHTGPTAVSGNTWTNSLNTLTINANGYQTQPWFGGGIRQRESDERYDLISQYILPRDLQHGSGITEGFYYTNSAGFRDPRQGLKLKVKNIVQINSPMECGWFAIGDPPTLLPWTNVQFLCDIDFVKAYTQTGISGSPGSVGTRLNIQTPAGPQIKINGGSFRFVDFNTDLEVAYTTDRAFAQQIENVNPFPYERVSRLNLNEVFAEVISAKKAGIVNINGGTAARVFLSQYPYMISNTFYENLNQQWRGGLTTDSYNETTAVISCDFNKHAVQVDLTGRTSGSQAGELYLEGTPFFMNNGSGGERSSYGSVWNDEYSRRNLQSNGKAQRVVLGKTGGIYVPYINIVSAIEGPQGLEFQRLSWELQFGSSANVDRIDNEGGFIYTADTLSNYATIKIGELHLSKYGRIDFGKRQREFDDWRIGGLTANFIVGGIIMDDGNGIIDGSAGVRLVPTFQLSGGAQRRSASPTTTAGKSLETPYKASKITK